MADKLIASWTVEGIEYRFSQIGDSPGYQRAGFSKEQRILFEIFDTSAKRYPEAGLSYFLDEAIGSAPAEVIEILKQHGSPGWTW